MDYAENAVLVLKDSLLGPPQLKDHNALVTSILTYLLVYQEVFHM